MKVNDDLNGKKPNSDKTPQFSFKDVHLRKKICGHKIRQTSCDLSVTKNEMVPKANK